MTVKNTKLNDAIVKRSKRFFKHCNQIIEELGNDGEYTSKDKMRFVKFMSKAASQLAAGKGFSKDSPILGVSSRNLDWFIRILGLYPEKRIENFSSDNCISRFVVESSIEEFESDDYNDEEEDFDMLTTLYSEFCESDRANLFKINLCALGCHYFVELPKEEAKERKRKG